MILMGAVTTALTACAVVQNAQLQSGAKEAQQMIAEKCGLLLTSSPQESSAWVNTIPKMKICTDGKTEPWDRADAVAVAECGANVMNENIRPYASSKKRFDELMKERAQEYKDYADSKISWEELGDRASQRRREYLRASDESGSGSYFAYSQCHNAIMQEKVYPVYPDALKTLLTGYLADVSAFSRQADKTNMPQEDYMIGTQQLWAKFTSKEQQRIQQVNNQGAPWANAIQAMNTEMQKQELHKAQVDALKSENDTKQTNCSVWNNQMNCTTW